MSRLGFGIGAAPAAIVLGQSGLAASHTGNLVETTLATIVVPGGTLGPNGELQIMTFWSYTNSGNAKNIRVRWGGTLWRNVAPTTTLITRDLVVINNRNSVASQVAMNSNAGVVFGGSATAPTTATIDTSVDQTITITAQLASAGETMILESHSVKAFPRF